MQEVIDKESKTALSVQVSEKLIKEIRRGVFRPGKRMPGERMLAEQFGASRGTIIEALDLLEKQNYIERVPAKGTFIAEDVNHELSTVRIIFPFPEASLSPDAIGSMENWGAVSEVYRGMVTEAKEQQAEIAFQHFEDTDKAIQIRRQSRRMEEFDGAILIGYQLSGLRQALISDNKYCVNIISRKNDSATFSTVFSEYATVFNALAAHLAANGYRRLRVLDIITSQRIPVDNEQEISKLSAMRAAAASHGIEADPAWIYRANRPDINGLSKFIAGSGWDMTSRKDAIFCVYTEGVPLLYKYCMENNIILGKNVGAFGYASGMTFNNLLPEFTHCKIDHFNIGRTACRMVIDAIRTGNRTPRHESVSAKLIIQKST
ncbi:MAG: GntR family transcriptional regulator [Victivallaceae bacterium]|jgi:DNA-binding LacI/PurR family transcriptional regulator